MSSKQQPPPPQQRQPQPCRLLIGPEPSVAPLSTRQNPFPSAVQGTYSPRPPPARRRSPSAPKGPQSKPARVPPGPPRSARERRLAKGCFHPPGPSGPPPESGVRLEAAACALPALPAARRRFRGSLDRRFYSLSVPYPSRSSRPCTPQRAGASAAAGGPRSRARYHKVAR